MRKVKVYHLFVAIALLFVVIFGGSIAWEASTSETRHENATTQARAYVRTMHADWQNPNVSCQSVDTDANGYVTCAVNNGSGYPETIERASYVVDSLNFNRGCRPARMTIPVPTSDR